MTRKLILLTGLHKTGTTSIQKACHANRQTLTTAGYLYPTLSMQNSGNDAYPENQSALIGHMFRSQFAFWDQNGVEKHVLNPNKDLFRNKVAEHLASVLPANIIIVAEQISTLAHEDMADLKTYFLSLGFTIQPHCVIRKPVGWVNSWISQRVAGARGPRLTIQQSIDEIVRRGSIFQKRIETIQSIFPDARFTSFDEVTSNFNGPSDWFFKQLGLNGPQSSSKYNEGGSDTSVRFASHMNEEVFLKRKISRRHPSIDSLLGIRISGPGGRKFYLRQSEVAPMLPLLLEENSWLKDRFGAGFYDEDILYANEPVTLHDEEKRLLESHFSQAEEPIRSIVMAYVAQR